MQNKQYSSYGVKMRKLVFKVMAWESSLEKLQPYALEDWKKWIQMTTNRLRFPNSAYYYFYSFDLYDTEVIPFMLCRLGR